TWPDAKSAAMAAGATTRFVIMDGGGNDVLLGETKCLDNGAMRQNDPDCKKIVDDATAAAKKLQIQMIADGVQQVLYFFYPHVPAGGWDMTDYAFPIAKAQCEGMNNDKFQCYFVDTRETFQGVGNTGMANVQYLLADGIHPNAQGDDLLADLVWKTMKEHCM